MNTNDCKLFRRRDCDNVSDDSVSPIVLALLWYVLLACTPVFAHVNLRSTTMCLIVSMYSSLRLCLLDPSVLLDSRPSAHLSSGCDTSCPVIDSSSVHRALNADYSLVQRRRYLAASDLCHPDCTSPQHTCTLLTSARFQLVPFKFRTSESTLHAAHWPLSYAFPLQGSQQGWHKHQLLRQNQTWILRLLSSSHRVCLLTCVLNGYGTPCCHAASRLDQLLCSGITSEQAPAAGSHFPNCCVSGICDLGRRAYCGGPSVPAASTATFNISLDADECMCDPASIQQCYCRFALRNAENAWCHESVSSPGCLGAPHA